MVKESPAELAGALEMGYRLRASPADKRLLRVQEAMRHPACLSLSRGAAAWFVSWASIL